MTQQKNLPPAIAEILATFRSKQENGDFGNTYLDADRIEAWLPTAMASAVRAAAGDRIETPEPLLTAGYNARRADMLDFAASIEGKKGQNGC